MNSNKKNHVTCKKKMVKEMKKMMELKFQPIKHGRTERKETRLESTSASMLNIKTKSS